MHPGTEHDVAVGWHSPIQGLVKVMASVAHGQRGSDGIEWWIVQDAKAGRTNLAQGATSGTGSQTIPAEADAQALDKIAVVPGDLVSLVVGRKGLHHCDATIIEFTLTEVGGRGRVWNLTQDVVGTLHADNPHADGRGDAGVWHFCSEPPESSPQRSPSQPPIVLASKAASAREFIQELQARKLSTIRQQTHAHEEHTWEGAVTAMCGANLPPHPSPFQLPLSG